MVSFEPEDRVSIFVTRQRDLDGIARYLKKFLEGRRCDFRLTGFDVELPACFFDLNAKVDHSWDYLTSEDCANVDRFFFQELTRNWFGIKAFFRQDLDGYKELLLGRCTAYDFISNNHPLLKYLEVVRKVLISYAPTKILVVGDTPLLADIVELFSKEGKFEFLNVNPQANSISGRLGRLRKTARRFLTDLAISTLDFFVLRGVSISKRLKGKILIDHRLYENFSKTGLKDQLFVCFFEKGLRARLKVLSSRLLYFSLRAPSCFDGIFRRGKLRELLVKARKEIEQDRQVELVFRYNGIDFWDAIKKYIFKSLFRDLPRIATNISAFTEFAWRNQVKLVVMRHDLKDLERSLIFAARPLKIPTMVIQHGILGDPNMHIAMCADTTCVWGKSSMDWYRRFGFDGDAFVATGNPGYDELFERICANRKDGVKEKVCKKLGLDPSKKVVTFLTSSNLLFSCSFLRGDDMHRIIRGILESMPNVADMQLIVKVHPYDEDVVAYQRLIRDCGMAFRVAVTKDMPIFDILEASDLVMMTDSSSGLEGLILGKPLINVKIAKGEINVPYAERGVAIKVEKVEEFTSAIKEALYNERVREALGARREEFIFDFAYKIDGKATSRIEELIRKVTTNDQKGQ